MDSIELVEKVGASGWWIRTFDRFRDFYAYYFILWSVVTPFVITIILLYFIYERLPRSIVRPPEVVSGEYFIAICIVAVFLMCLVCVSAYEIHRQIKMRQKDEGMTYDRRGTLFNGREPNIAFRILTFQNILADISKHIEENMVEEAFVQTGKSAAVNFAANMPHIIDSHSPLDRRWSTLAFRDKLDVWSNYDSATGWGVFSSFQREQERMVVVRVSHYKGLFAGEGGGHFAQFLAGYCETLLTSIVAGHEDGIFHDYSAAKLRERKPVTADTIEFEYELI
jgi:hypothetical protein